MTSIVDEVPEAVGRKGLGGRFVSGSMFARDHLSDAEEASIRSWKLYFPSGLIPTPTMPRGYTAEW